ncbi:MAG TPA: DNA polymerase I [Balneolales bacterium]|nr:DNA polymerase I [Balneolales bacterium]
MSKDRLFLLDGMALAYRAHFAFINSNLRNSEGIPTGPVYGFAQTLVQLMEREKPTHIAVVWDTAAPTFRHKLDEQYKANRPPQPEDLTTGIPLIKDMVKRFGIQNLEHDGYEADDIIGTIAYEASGEDVDVFLVTPDKDFMQLVTDNVKMYKPLNHTKGFDIIDIEGVKKYFGVPPEKVIDVLALIGDNSDNIPGVPGIGKKGAPKVINEYGSVEAAIEAAPDIKSKRVREGLMQNADQARLSKKMITIITDVPDTAEWRSLEWKKKDTDTVIEFFKRMEFRSVMRRFLRISETKSSIGSDGSGQFSLFDDEESDSVTESGWDTLDEDNVEYHMINSYDELKKLVDNLSDENLICFDTETTGTDPITAELVGIALSVKSKEAYYIPVEVEGGLNTDKTINIIRPLFAKISLKIAQNYKYDYIMLKRYGLEIEGPVFDTMLAAYLLDSSQSLNMDALARKYLNYDPVSITTLIGKKGKKQKSMADIPAEKVYPYSCEDADITLQLYEILNDELKKDDLEAIAEEIEFPLTKVLAAMEMRGVQLDTDMLKQYSEELGEQIKKLEKEIYDKSGYEFNINSPQQLGDILFKKLKIPSKKKTRTGQYSTSERVLSGLAGEYEVPKLVLDYRALSKLKSTYVDAMPKLINPKTGRVHTNFNQSVAATGRLSSSNPNLQNIPIRTEKGREIRKAFTAKSGYKILSLDYSQVELRIIAAIADDEAMKQAFIDDEDIHSRTAKEIFNLESIDEVTPERRRKAKEVNFGIPYGVSAYGLAQRLGMANHEGKAIIDAYFERFPKIQTYINNTVEEARKNGFVKTLNGRRRYIPEINSPNGNIRGFAERTAINMPIQGTAADLIKIAMINIGDWLQQQKKKTQMIIQVHDELLFEVHEDELNSVPSKIKDLMESAMDIGVPLKVEMGIADNWLDAH